MLEFKGNPRGRDFSERSPIGALNINLTSGGQTTHCTGKIFYTVLRVPNHYVFTAFERNLRGRDFLLLTLADLSRLNYSMLDKILLHVDCRFHMQLFHEVVVNSEVM